MRSGITKWILGNIVFFSRNREGKLCINIIAKEP
jgi:hypothetical protein